MNTLNIVRAVVTFILIVSSAYAGVLPTGQTQCYDTYGTVIDCSGTGQDGEFANEIPSNRFINNHDGTLTDSVTGLTWVSNTRCVPYFGDRSLGQTYVDLLIRLDDFNTFPDMYMECSDRGYAADELIGKYSDWRVPTLEELKSLFNYGKTSVKEYLEREGFEYPSMSYSDTAQPEWNINHYMMSMSTMYGGNSLGTWHNTSTNGNTTHATGGLMLVRGDRIEVKSPELTEVDIDVYLDAKTGLKWHVTGQRMKWKDALAYAQNEGLRLPNINELLSIYDFNSNPHLEIARPNYYWSSTTQNGKGKSAWIVDFKDGSTMVSRTRYKTSRYYVLLVEDSPIQLEEKIEEDENYTGSFVVTDPKKEVQVSDILKDAGYSNELYAVIEDQEIFLFESGSDEIVNLGLFPVGTVINFKLAVLTTGYDYYTGVPENNPDGVDHCTIHGNNGIWTFGFEDMYNGGDKDYNDCVFMVTGVVPTEGSEVEVQ